MVLTRTRNIPRSLRLQQLQSRCVERLGLQLRKMLDHIDDVFFDLADGAASSDSQNEYFQAMREVRMQRDTLESSFKILLADAFIGAEHESRLPTTDAALPADITVAVEAMASRIRNQHPAVLLQIEKRLQLLMPEVSEPAHLPMAPERICRAFMTSLQKMDMSPNAQLILLKHFEREVLPEFTALARDALDILHAGRVDENDAVVNTQKPRMAATTDAQFLQRLEQLQKQILDHGHDADTDALAQWRQQIRQGAQTPRQENMINAVFMLFEYMLDRQELNATQATAFARLQIPVIRVAMQDNHFIRDASHPVRRLLKTLANVTLRRKRSGQDDATLAHALDHAVTSLLRNDNVLDEALCRQLENDFLSTVSGQSANVRPSVNTRLWDTSSDDADHSRTLVDQLLKNRLQGKCVPEAFLHFMGGAWTHWLCYCREANGNASPAWLDALQLTDELIWSVQPHTDDASHQRWMKRLPSLVKSVTDALGQKLPPQERDAAIEALWVMHAALLKNDPQLRFVTLDFTATAPATPIV